MSTSKDQKKIVDEILETLPWRDRQRVIDAGKKFRKPEPPREKLSPEVVERLYFQVLNEAKERGK